jgi:hypothetical protein
MVVISPTFSMPRKESEYWLEAEDVLNESGITTLFILQYKAFSTMNGVFKADLYFEEIFLFKI